MSADGKALLTRRLTTGSYADRLRVAAALLDDAAGHSTGEVRGLLLMQRAALIASDVSTCVYDTLREHLGIEVTS